MLYGRPITRVELVGVVVGVRETARFVKYSLDDGSGTIAQCIQWRENDDGGRKADAPEALELGQTACVQGKLSVHQPRHAAGDDPTASSSSSSSSSSSAVAAAAAVEGAAAVGAAPGAVPRSEPLARGGPTAVPHPGGIGSDGEEGAAAACAAAAAAAAAAAPAVEREVTIQRVRRLDPASADEARHWLDAMRLARTVYSIPLPVPPAVSTAAARTQLPAAAAAAAASGGGSGCGESGGAARAALCFVPSSAIAAAAAAAHRTAGATDGAEGTDDAEAQGAHAGCVRCAAIVWDGGCFHDSELAEDPAATFRDMLVALLLDRQRGTRGGAAAAAAAVATAGAAKGAVCFADLQLLECVKASAAEVLQARQMRQQQQWLELQRRPRHKRRRTGNNGAQHAAAPAATATATAALPPKLSAPSISTLLRRSLASLQGDGVLFLSDVERDEYSLLTYDGVLAPELVQIIRAGAGAGAAAGGFGGGRRGRGGKVSGGMSATEIFQCTRQQASLGMVPQMLVNGVLERLAKGCEIYDTGEVGPGGCACFAPCL
jgi:hypothetical protein